jgi:hypothetical protein
MSKIDWRMAGKVAFFFKRLEWPMLEGLKMGAFIEVRPRSGHKGAVLINVDEIRLVETLESSHLGKYTAIHFRREAPPTAIDAHESYEVNKGLIAEALHSGIASSKASD